MTMLGSVILGALVLFSGFPLPAQQTQVEKNEAGDVLPLVPTRQLRFDLNEGTWVSLDVSPDGKKILFELLGDLYQMNSAGGEAHCVACGLPFDSQPVYSPDGATIAFISDRSGNENLWIARDDGSEPRQVSKMDDNSVFISPAWSRDGKSIFISRFKPDMNAFEIWRYFLDNAKVEQVTHAKSSPDTPKQFRTNALGAEVSPDGRYLYYEAKTGLGFDDDLTFPLWHIVRRDLITGQDETVVSAEGSAFRPGVSPDGKLLVYATRYEGETGLRVRNLVDGSDRWLLYPIQHDDQEASASRDLIPRYAFTPDSGLIILNYGGKIRSLNIASHEVQTIPFNARVDLGVGPSLRQSLREETGPVRARLIQTPSQSPDGKQLVFSALGHIYVMGIADRVARRLTTSVEPEFDPSWSRDGSSVAYITWTAAKGGNIWRTSRDGASAPLRLTDHADFYTNPVFDPDGKNILAIRASNYERNHHFLEFGPVEADAIQLSAEGGPAKVITSGVMNNEPQFAQPRDRIYINFSDGLYEVPLDGSPKRRILRATGPTYYFVDGTAPADAIKISPDGKWALARMNQQLYLIQILPTGKELAIELGKPSPLQARLTSVGADFFDWADGGTTITWAIGSTFFRQPLASVSLGRVDPPTDPDEKRNDVQSIAVKVEVPRDIPHGSLVLRGATAITMREDEVIPDSEIVVVDNRIAAVGARGTIKLPNGATIRDVSGKYVIPGFTDTHMHWGEVRRGVLDLQDWGFTATLAYGVTSALDPSPLSIDMFGYQDLIEAGMMTGTRVYTTGPALFSFNNFQSEQQAVNVIVRYPEFYRTRNLKEYRTGNRKQREWVAEAARVLHVMPTTEGALDMKLDMTQIQDGFPGNEHAYSAAPLADDIVQLFARTGVSYTPTLQISNGGIPAQQFFYAKASPHDDAKLRHFEPHYFVDHKTERLRWALSSEYLFPQVAEGAARIQRAGGLVGVGSHGELPGLGYHLELQALAAGGMTPHEVLQAATIGSSKTIGRDAELGSLEPGKFADLIILDKDPLVDVRNTLSINEVMKNGRLYTGDTLDEVWPDKRPLPPLWFRNADTN